MDRPRLIRWLRISVSAVCVVVCGLLIGLWVRSYSAPHIVSNLWAGVQFDGQIPTVKSWILYSRLGQFTLVVYELPPSPGSARNRKGRFAETQNIIEGISRQNGNSLGFKYEHFPKLGAHFVKVPCWFLLSLSATFAAVPWIRWRFSLKTMLIVTAVVAVVLGIVVWLIR